MVCARDVRKKISDFEYKCAQNAIFIAQSKFHFHPFDPLEYPLTVAIEVHLAKLDSGTACEQEKISIFESQVELGGLTQNDLLPKKILLHR